MTRINLLPAARKQALLCRMHLRIWLGVLLGFAMMLPVVCVTARVAWSTAGSADDRQLQAARDLVRQSEASLAAMRKEMAPLSTRHRMVSLLVNQPSWADFLRLIGDALGQDLVLRDIRIQQVVAPSTGSQASAPAKRPAGCTYKVELRGLAKSQTSISQRVKELENLKLFDEVRILRTGREPFLSGTATSFELECSLTDSGGN